LCVAAGRCSRQGFCELGRARPHLCTALHRFRTLRCRVGRRRSADRRAVRVGAGAV